MTWQVGDLAVCVDARANPEISRPGKLVEGRTYHVTAVMVYEPLAHCLYGQETVGLRLGGMATSARDGAFAASRFRKVTPDKREACEDEFVTLLKRCKRKVGA